MFIVITTALVLKNNLAIEVVTEDAYDVNPQAIYCCL